MDDLAGVVAAFEAAARSFDAARALLLHVISEGQQESNEGPLDGCQHPDAINVSTMGRGTMIFCPDCGAEVEQ